MPTRKGKELSYLDLRWEKVFKYYPHLRKEKERAEKELKIKLDGCIRWDMWRFDTKEQRPKVMEGEDLLASIYLEKNTNTFCIEFNPQTIKKPPEISLLYFLHEIGHVSMGHFEKEDQSWYIKDESKPFYKRRTEKEAEAYAVSRLGVKKWKEMALVEERDKNWILSVIRKYKKLFSEKEKEQKK